MNNQLVWGALIFASGFGLCMLIHTPPHVFQGWLQSSGVGDSPWIWVAVGGIFLYLTVTPLLKFVKDNDVIFRVKSRAEVKDDD